MTFVEHRTRAGLSQREAASESGIPLRTIKAIEQGQIANPSANTAKALARAYGITIDELLGDDET